MQTRQHSRLYATYRHRRGNQPECTRLPFCHYLDNITDSVSARHSTVREPFLSPATLQLLYQTSEPAEISLLTSTYANKSNYVHKMVCIARFQLAGIYFSVVKSCLSMPSR